jgi:hypothetical protein
MTKRVASELGDLMYALIRDPKTRTQLRRLVKTAGGINIGPAAGTILEEEKHASADDH